MFKGNYLLINIKYELNAKQKGRTISFSVLFRNLCQPGAFVHQFFTIVQIWNIVNINIMIYFDKNLQK